MAAWDVYDTRIVTIAERPDLAPLVARWQHEAFGDDESLDNAIRRVSSQVATEGPEQVFVLLVDGEPAGTASLTHDDLYEEIPLTPWLASVFVPPAFRSRGYAARLVRCVEQAAQDFGTSRLWLYTGSAAALYARLGWIEERPTTDRGRPVMLMRRDFD